MSTQIAVRLDEPELTVLDAVVAEGWASSRSDAVRRSIVYLDRRRRYRDDAVIFARLAGAGEAIYPDFDALPVPDLGDLAP